MIRGMMNTLPLSDAHHGEMKRAELRGCLRVQARGANLTVGTRSSNQLQDQVTLLAQITP